MKKKKLLSILLALVMVAALLPSSAFAAEESGSGENWHYVIMNVPYADFYKAYGVDDAAYYKLPDGIDGVSTATTSKAFGSTGGATYNDGVAYVLGVTLPVQVSDEAYNQMDTSLKGDAHKNYGYTDLETAPAYYSTLNIGEDGNYTFSKIADSSMSTDYLSIEPDEDYNKSSDGFLTSVYGDYQIAVGGYSTTKGLQTGENEYTAVSLYGAVLNVTNTFYTDENGDTVTGNKAFGMTAGENLWIGNRKVEAQIAWSIKDGKDLHINHDKGDALYYQFDMNGGILSSVTLITSEGLVKISKSKTDGSAGVKLPRYYPGDLSGLAYSINNEEAELAISGIPDDLEDVTISLSGGLATDATAVDGKVTLEAVPTAGVNYTLTISSSNYPDITRTLSTPMTVAQQAALQTWVNKANATGKVETDGTLKEHVSEATEMIAAFSDSSFNAATLIDELKALVKPYFPKAEAAATLKGSALDIDLAGVELNALENPTYTLAFRAGRNLKTLAGGDLTALAFTLDAEPTVGTEYILTIVSDNYQDITTTVTAAEEETKSIADVIVSAVAAQPYTGKAIMPTVTVKKGAITLKCGTDYTVAYKNNTNPGMATITIKGNGNYTGTKSVTFKIIPKKAAVSKLTSTKKAVLKVTWKKDTKATGYQVVIAKNKTFTSGRKTATITKNKTTSKTFTKLTKGKKYYAKVRAYKNISGKKVYGAYSAVKSKTVKKK